MSGEPVKPETMAGLVEYLRRMCYAGQLRGIAVAYVDPSGNDYQLVAMAHLDVAAAAGVAKGLHKLGELLEVDALNSN